MTPEKSEAEKIKEESVKYFLNALKQGNIYYRVAKLDMNSRIFLLNILEHSIDLTISKTQQRIFEEIEKHRVNDDFIYVYQLLESDLNELKKRFEK